MGKRKSPLAPEVPVTRRETRETWGNNKQKESARCISNSEKVTSQVVTTPGKVRMTQSWEGMESRKTTVAMPCSWKRRFVTDSSVRCLVFSQFNYLSPLVPPLESLRARA